MLRARERPTARPAVARARTNCCVHKYTAATMAKAAADVGLPQDVTTPPTPTKKPPNRACPRPIRTSPPTARIIPSRATDRYPGLRIGRAQRVVTPTANIRTTREEAE